MYIGRMFLSTWKGSLFYNPNYITTSHNSYHIYLTLIATFVALQQLLLKSVMYKISSHMLWEVCGHQPRVVVMALDSAIVHYLSRVSTEVR